MLFVKEWFDNVVLNQSVLVWREKSVSQDKIIFSTLRNFVINGLEKQIRDSIDLFTKSKKKRILIALKDENKSWIESYFTYIRYVDNLVVVVKSQHFLKNYVIPSIVSFLKKRGLKLNSQRTKIFRLLDKSASLNFLGYTFKYNIKWNIKSHVFYTCHARLHDIELYPNKKKVYSFFTETKFIFKKSNNLDAYHLIAKLNLILRGWLKYYTIANFSDYRDTVQNIFHRLSWEWAKRKHKRWGKKTIANTYFLRKIKIEKKHFEVQNFEMGKIKKQKYPKFKTPKWVFHGKFKSKNRYNICKSKTIYLVSTSNISKLWSNKRFIPSKKIQSIHGYHLNYMRLIMLNTHF